MNNTNESSKLGGLFWLAPDSLASPELPRKNDSSSSSFHDGGTTSVGDTAEIDEMSSEAYYMNDTDSLSGFLRDDPLEKLELMDTNTTVNTSSTSIEDEEEDRDRRHQNQRSITTVELLYDQIQAFMYGMNQKQINHQAALDLAQKNPLDPVCTAVQALLHRDDATANELWNKANRLGISCRVEHGCGFVQALVGKMLEDGVGGVVKDSRGAEFWYTRAARNGHAAAQFFLGQFHVKACQYDKARHWLEKAAKQGHARAQMHFGLLFEHGRVGMRGRRDYERAKEWYQKATRQGDAKAACRLGFIVRKRNHQDGVRDTEPVKYDNLVATDWQNPPSLGFAGQEQTSVSHEVVEDVNSIPQNDDVLAVKNLWLDEQGNSKKRRLEVSVAPADAGVDMMTDEDPLPLIVSPNSALAWGKSPERYDETITGGSKEFTSQLYTRIECLLYGMNTTKVDQQAALALAQEHPADPVLICIQAMLHRDESAATVFWKRANELGISSLVELGGGLVQALVGKMLENGFGGVKQNLRRAEFWYNQAAKRGHATAQFFLGLFHVKNGEYESSKFWLEQAAKRGHARAQMHFGLLYEHSHDFETAKFWYKRAVAQGDSKAKYRLDFIEGKMRQRLSPVAFKLPPMVMPVNSFPGFPVQSVADGSRTGSRPGVGWFASVETSGLQQFYDSRLDITRSSALAIESESTAIEGEAVGSYLRSQSKEASSSVILEPDVIKPYFAILADKSTRGSRLTQGTKVLREIKEWYKENRTDYVESDRESMLFEEAIERYFAKMASLFDDFPTDRRAKEETLLVKCTKKSLESNRVDRPNCFRYQGEKECQYGTAKLPNAVLFFFESRDPPKLDTEVTRYKRKLGARPDIQGDGRTYFQSYLDFCAMTASAAARGCQSAQIAVEKNNFLRTYSLISVMTIVEGFLSHLLLILSA
jgi:TPR repeat protein